MRNKLLSIVKKQFNRHRERCTKMSAQIKQTARDKKESKEKSKIGRLKFL